MTLKDEAAARQSTETGRTAPPPTEPKDAVEPSPKRRRSDRANPISFGKAYAQSDTFRVLFREGMSLVEETADYLDGAGRTAARHLHRPASIVYATESMRLTTRLMQLASWLLLHRSVREGDMTAERAREEKRKIRLEKLSTGMEGPGWDELPPDFRLLIERSLNLQNRVERIDTALLEPDLAVANDANPVNLQLKELAAAFRPAS
jgi:regulator of CtrA degradation